MRKNFMNNFNLTKLLKILLMSVFILTLLVGPVLFGQSEKGPAYLNPNLSIEERVQDLLSRMTLEEKIEQLSGNESGFSTKPNERLGIPGIKCTDGPVGVRWIRATAFPTSILMGSSWDIELMEKVASAIAKETKARGRNQLLGPCINIIRDPRGGRSAETYGEDPYLISKMAVAYIKGIQSQKIIATPKHYACNNQENGRGTNNVKIDERLLREFYLPHFQASICEAQAWSIMSAYNLLNGSYCSENEHLLRNILKNEWGFKGFVISDWGACHSTIPSAKNGLDLEMPHTQFFGKPLLDAVKQGLVSEETINDSVGRILRAKFWTGLFEEKPKLDKKVINCQEHQELAKDAAKAGIVLLKNERNILPLDKNKIKKIAVIGPNAGIARPHLGGSAKVVPFYAISVLDGIKLKIGDKMEISYVKGCDINTSISESMNEAINIAKKSDVAIVAVGLNSDIETEGRDRDYLNLPEIQEDLIKKISKANKNTVVVLIGGIGITMQSWIDKVPALLVAWYPGEQGGSAIADILFGDYNPSGKLPITFPKSLEQLPPYDNNYESASVCRGYRYYEKHKIEPQFPFGFGLSYTKFNYSNLKIEPKNISVEGKVNVSLGIQNIGKYEGSEVIQLYVRDVVSSVDRPVKELKGFKKINLKIGEKKTVSFTLTEKELSFYNVNKKKFVVEPGKFEVLIGASSRDIRLKDGFEVK